MHICLCCPDWAAAGATNAIISYTAAVREHLISPGHDVSVLAHGRLHRSDGQSITLSGPEAGGPMAQVQARLREKLSRRRGESPAVGHAVAAQVLAAHRIAPVDVHFCRGPIEDEPA